MKFKFKPPSDSRWIIIGLQTATRKETTVGYYRDGEYYDMLDNCTPDGDSHTPMCIWKPFVKYWTEMPEFEERP